MTIPKEVKLVLKTLQDAGHEAFIVGGCVRDFLMDKKPHDWDVTTNAEPEQVQKLFPESFYLNDFGTVTVKTDSEGETVKEIQVTTYRVDESYSDKRHPDSVKFTKSLEEDLARRDFTMNAIAMDASGKITDPFGGVADIDKKVIRAVGDPNKRFEEDALRVMRAVRFSTVLDFKIETKTMEAINSHAGSLRAISKERIRDELVKMINCPGAMQGIELLRETKLLEHIVPELLEGYGVGQNKHHIYTVWEHNLRALKYAVDKNYNFNIRMGSLLHDVGKPRSKRGDGPDSTFYAHEIIGGKMAFQIMTRLCFPKDVIEKVTHLVRYHLFYYNVGEVSEAGVRRFLSRVGPENVDDLIKIREADRIGSGVPKAVPYKLRHLLFMIEKVKRDPISAKMLKVNGQDVMKIADISPSPKVGQILAVLLEDVLDDPENNNLEYLEPRIKELSQLSDEELVKMKQKAQEVKEEFESGAEQEIKKKFHV